MPHSIWSDSLAIFSDSVAATRPAPAGVAAACVAGNLGISLLIKTLAITGGQAELLESARLEAAHLRGAADHRCADASRARRGRRSGAVRQGNREARVIGGSRCGASAANGCAAGDSDLHRRQLART